MVPGVSPLAVARGRRWLRRIAVWATAAFVAWWSVGMLGALLLTAARPQVVAPCASLAGAAVEAVTATADDGSLLRGWLVRAAPTSGRCVVLAAGIRGCRLAMVERAKWYLAQGWSTLLVDLRGTGESAPARIAMGWHEALDLVAWHRFATARGFSQVGVHGQSLGAAAAVYSAVRAEPAPAWHFVVLESCYLDARAALAARLPWLPRPLLWPLVACSEWLLAVDADELSPQRAIARLRAPMLIACGDRDEKVGPGAADALFTACGASQKERVDLPGVGHVDLWPAVDGLLPRRLAAFLAAR